MSKVYVIGVSESKGVSKKTGKPYHAVNFQCVKRSASCHGRAVEDLYVNAETFPVEELMDEAGAKSLTDFIGCFLDVSRDNKGWLEDIQFLAKDPSAVTIDF